VVAVAALSSQTHGTGAVPYLSPRPLLLLHGMDDEVLPDSCSREIYDRGEAAQGPPLYPGSRHALDECREDVDRDLMGWLQTVLS